jgi:hypothetical protein
VTLESTLQFIEAVRPTVSIVGGMHLWLITSRVTIEIAAARPSPLLACG